VRPLLPTTRLHPGAYAVIRRQTDDEMLEEKVVLVPSVGHEEEEAKGWAAVGFGAIRGGDSPASQIFWEVFHKIWLALPTTQPSKANAAQVVVIWQLAGGIWSEVDDDMKIKIENRSKRMLGASVPIRNSPPTATECQAQLRASLSRVLEMCRSMINRRRLDWDLTDVSALYGVSFVDQAHMALLRFGPSTLVVAAPREFAGPRQILLLAQP